MTYRIKSLQRKDNSNSAFGNSLEALTIDQRARTFRRIATELTARPAATATVHTDAGSIASIAVAHIARRARVSHLHAAVVAELSGFGGVR